MLHDFIKDTLVILSSLLMVINLVDLNKSLQVQDSILRITTRLLQGRVWRAGETEFDWSLPSNFLSLSSKAFQLKWILILKETGSGQNLTKSPYTPGDPSQFSRTRPKNATAPKHAGQRKSVPNDLHKVTKKCGKAKKNIREQNTLLTSVEKTFALE